MTVSVCLFVSACDSKCVSACDSKCVSVCDSKCVTVSVCLTTVCD